MKAYKTITIITVILAIALITVVSIFGVYKKDEFRIVNTAPKYELGMEFTESVIINLEVDDTIEDVRMYDPEGNLVEEYDEEMDDEYTEENGYTMEYDFLNPLELLTEANYEKSKDILISRLTMVGAEQYIISQNKSTGKITIEVPENADTPTIIDLMTAKGSFEIVDSDTGTVLMDNKDVDSAQVLYGQQPSGGVTVYLQIIFNKEGAKKLEVISEKYKEIETKEATYDEEGNVVEEAVEQPNVSLMFDGQTYQTTYFADKMTDGMLNLQMGTYTNQEEQDFYVTQAKLLSLILNTGEIPITYTAGYEGLLSRMENSDIMVFAGIGAALLVAVLIVLLIKFRVQGIYVFILGIGYMSSLILLVRLVDITLTIEGILGMVFMSLLNYLCIYKVLETMREEGLRSEDAIKNNIIKFSERLVPIYMIALLFIFASILNISSLGSTLFWGSFLMYIYNIVFTNVLLSVVEKGA